MFAVAGTPDLEQGVQWLAVAIKDNTRQRGWLSLKPTQTARWCHPNTLLSLANSGKSRIITLIGHADF
jgi:hypothetical protein